MGPTLRAPLLLLAFLLTGRALAEFPEDPWLAVEDGWIWRVVDIPQDLAGSWKLGHVLPDGVTYRMTFDVTNVQGQVGLYLGDNQRVLIDKPGQYSYAFTANDRKRMVFQATKLDNGRALFAANTIRVSTDSSSRTRPSQDPWLAIEEGWIWRVVSSEQVLAGSRTLSNDQLPGGYVYDMTFNVRSIEGEIALSLGDNEPVVLRAPGAYRYSFTADRMKRMVFESVGFHGGRTKLAADTIRVTVGAAADRENDARARVAYSSDGNAHDADDWSASPLTLAMLADERGGFELVHFDYNNHLGNSDAAAAKTHRGIVEEAGTRYGLNPSRFFDDQQDLQGAVDNLAAMINASSAEDRLYLICAGPMEVCWRGINAALDSQERFVTLITHSWWNDTHSDTALLAHTLDDIDRDFDVEIRRIPDQNATAFRSPVEEWMWLQQHGSNGQWLYERITAGGRTSHPGDASDSGMTYYVLDGMGKDSENATMIDIRALFND